MSEPIGELTISSAARLRPGDVVRITGVNSWELIDLPRIEHSHVEVVREYLDNAGITPETLRYAATHEALCRHWIFDLLQGLATTLEEAQ